VAWEQHDIHENVIRIIDQQKESMNKCALSNVPPPSTMNATDAAAADGNVGDFPMMMMSQWGWSMTSAVLRPLGKGGGGSNGGGHNDRSGVRPPLSLHQ
jgi:hypothetical protein